MDQDTYEQLMRVQISLDELKEKMDLVLDQIDELKGMTKKDRSSGQKQEQDVRDQHSAEQSCRNTPDKEQTNHTQSLQKCSMKIPGWQSPGLK